MGGPSYDIKDPILQLKVAASSCFFGEPDYYHTGGDTSLRISGHRSSHYQYLAETLGEFEPSNWADSTTSIMESSIDAALTHDAEATLKFACELRNRGMIRTTPQIIMVRAAMHPSVKGTTLIGKYFRDIIKRADEPSTQLAYYLSQIGASKGHKKIPNSLKRAWRTYLASCDEYTLAKYRMGSREVKTIDVVNLVHPTRTGPINALMTDSLRTTDKTWESIVSSAGSNPASKKAAWTESIDVMGHMALLRNIRNMTQAGIDPSAYVGKLIGTAKYGKQLPFRYFTAYENTKGSAPQVLDAIEECLEISVDNLPRFPGKVMSLCDNSGSAHSCNVSSMSQTTVSQIGNLSGILTGRAAEEGYVGIFGDGFKTMPVRKKESILEMTRKAGKMGSAIGQGTEHGAWMFWDQAIKTKEHWDYVFMYSDMQAGHGGLYGNSDVSNDVVWTGGSGRAGGYGRSRYIDIPKLVSRYRSDVNPDVQVFLVQTAGYKDTLFPEYFDKTYIMGGWSSSIIQFAAEMSGLTGPQQ